MVAWCGSLLAWIGGRGAESGLGLGLPTCRGCGGERAASTVIFENKLFSKHPKAAHGCSEKWRGTHQKKQIVFKNKT
jgi:hypothetical protein